jgi:predicted cupin superfamily sugar epimerase
MHPRAAELIESLAMSPHPEGGYFRELFRAERAVDPLDGRERRPALTAIWFLMLSGQKSAWHVVDSDEIWIHFEGEPIHLHTFDVASARLETILLGPLGPDSAPQRVVPAGIWQAAEPTGDYSLSGACVGPGFDFADFRLLDADPVAHAALRAAAPELLRLA